MAPCLSLINKMVNTHPWDSTSWATQQSEGTETSLK